MFCRSPFKIFGNLRCYNHPMMENRPLNNSTLAWEDGDYVHVCEDECQAPKNTQRSLQDDDQDQQKSRNVYSNQSVNCQCDHLGEEFVVLNEDLSALDEEYFDRIGDHSRQQESQEYGEEGVINQSLWEEIIPGEEFVEEFVELDEELDDLETSQEFGQESHINSCFQHLKTGEYEKPDDQDSKICVVCQEEFENGEIFTRLECGHEYHACCIKRWLLKHNACPICKRIAVKQES